jgi:hypothetical protein
MNDPLNPIICSDYFLTGSAYYLHHGIIDFPYTVLHIRRDGQKYTAVFDLSNPYNPQLYRFAKGGGVNEIKGIKLYSLENSSNGSSMLKIADIHHPDFWIDSIDLHTHSFDIQVSDSLAYIAKPGTLKVLNVITGQELSNLYHGKPDAVILSFDYPRLALPYTPMINTYGFLLFDVSDPYNPNLLFDTLIYEPPLSTGGNIVGCDLQDSLLYLCRDDYGFDIWNVSNIDSVHRLIIQETPTAAELIQSHGDYIYVLDDPSIEIYHIIDQSIEEDKYSLLNHINSLTISPNPFRVLTTLTLPPCTECKGLKIYNAAGQVVKSFVVPSSRFLVPTMVNWDGTDDHGNQLPSGIYFIKLEGSGESVVKKAIRLR